MTSPDVYEILNRLPQPDAKVLRQAIENLKTERDFERHESELVFAFGFQVEELRRKLHECEKKRDEWQATAEKAIDASSEGTWMARAFDAERELAALEKTSAALREFVSDEAEGDCAYGDNCPSNAGTRHGTCRSCKARQTLAACGIHVWFEHDDLEACRNCGVVRREDDGNKPCKGKVALALR